MINPIKDIKPSDIAQNVSYRGRVEYFWNENTNNNNCTLRLSDIKVADKAEYRARIETVVEKEKWMSCFSKHLSVTGSFTLTLTFHYYQSYNQTNH